MTLRSHKTDSLVILCFLCVHLSTAVFGEHAIANVATYSTFDLGISSGIVARSTPQGITQGQIADEFTPVFRTFVCGLYAGRHRNLRHAIPGYCRGMPHWLVSVLAAEGSRSVSVQGPVRTSSRRLTYAAGQELF